MNKYKVYFNHGAFFRTVIAADEDLALEKALRKLTEMQRKNAYYWDIIPVEA